MRATLAGSLSHRINVFSFFVIMNFSSFRIRNAFCLIREFKTSQNKQRFMREAGYKVETVLTINSILIISTNQTMYAIQQQVNKNQHHTDQQIKPLLSG